MRLCMCIWMRVCVYRRSAERSESSRSRPDQGVSSLTERAGCFAYVCMCMCTLTYDAVRASSLSAAEAMEAAPEVHGR